MSLITGENGEFVSDPNAEGVALLVPSEILGLLGDPPLVRGEDPEDYHRLFNQLAATIDPQDFVEWIFTKDILDLVWEIKRWRGVKSAFFETELLRSGSHLVKELLEDAAGGFVYDGRGEARQLVARANTGDQESQNKISDLLTTNGLGQNAILSHALVYKLNDVERLEKLIASAEKRRDDLLKSIDIRRQTLAKRLKQASDKMIDELEVEETAIPSIQ